MSEIKFVSLNLRGYNNSKRLYTNSVLNRCNFLLLQEHWLSESQTRWLTDINRDFLLLATSGFDCERVLRARPYGGCAFMWRRSLDVKAKLTEVASRRIIAVTIEYSSFTILLANVYMPYECSEDTALYDDFCYQLRMLDSLLDNHTQ